MQKQHQLTVQRAPSNAIDGGGMVLLPKAPSIHGSLGAGHDKCQASGRFLTDLHRRLASLGQVLRPPLAVRQGCDIMLLNELGVFLLEVKIHEGPGPLVVRLPAPDFRPLWSLVVRLIVGGRARDYVLDWDILERSHAATIAGDQLRLQVQHLLNTSFPAWDAQLASGVRSLHMVLPGSDEPPGGQPPPSRDDFNPRWLPPSFLNKADSEEIIKMRASRTFRQMLDEVCRETGKSRTRVIEEAFGWRYGVDCPDSPHIPDEIRRDLKEFGHDRLPRFYWRRKQEGAEHGREPDPERDKP